MVRKYSKKKRKSLTYNSRKKTKKNKKTYKYRKGGTKYTPYLDFPFKFTYKDITDNKGDIKELENPKDINSYEVDRVYLIQFINDHQYYYQYRVKNVVNDKIIVIPVLPQGKIYSQSSFGLLKPIQIKVINIEYSYVVLPKYDNTTYYESQKQFLDSQPNNVLPDELSSEIFSYLKK
jgi:hypothetical protein